MSKLMKYRVVRGHIGDKEYAEGDIRTARDTDVGHLVPNVLELLGAAPAPRPKKAKKASAPHPNKATQPLQTKAE